MKPEKNEVQEVDKPGFDNKASIGVPNDRSQVQIQADMMASVNSVMVRDPEGPIKVKEPTFRDPEPPHKMQYHEVRYKEIQVPHEDVIFYTHSVVMDRNNSHSATVLLGNNRLVHIFDRTYTWNGRIYHRCAWIPNRVERAGILYCKMIHRITRRPIAVLRSFKGTSEPMYRIVGGQEADYRDLKRIYERAFISRKHGEEDDELDKFQYDAITPIEAELVG